MKLKKETKKKNNLATNNSAIKTYICIYENSYFSTILKAKIHY